MNNLVEKIYFCGGSLVGYAEIVQYWCTMIQCSRMVIIRADGLHTKWDKEQQRQIEKGGEKVARRVDMSATPAPLDSALPNTSHDDVLPCRVLSALLAIFSPNFTVW